MPSISYSIGTKFDESSSTATGLGVYQSATESYYSFFDAESGSIRFLETDEPRMSTISIGRSDVSIRYDFSDHAGRLRFIGHDYGDVLIGGSGNDSLDGGAGDDTIMGGGGSNTLAGGDGVDTLSYETSTGGVVVDLGDGYASRGGVSDIISGFENVRGTIVNDILYGDGGNNVIEGGGGVDFLYGLGGDDRIVVRGFDPGSFVDGGDGHDILILEGSQFYEFTDGSFTGIEQVNVGDRSIADFSALGETPGEFRSMSAANGAITLTTTEFGESIRLGKGADILDAAGGDDKIFVSGTGTATIDGGDGFDRLYVQSGLHFFTDDTLQNVEIVTVRGGAGVSLIDMTQGMKIVSTSAAGGHASIVGSAGDDVIRLGAGGDLVTGGAGDDRLYGGAGADSFYFHAGDFGRDQVFADLGADHVVFMSIATSLDDLSYRTAANGLDVVVTVDGLDAKTNSIFLKDVTIEEVRAAEDSFFLFV